MAPVFDSSMDTEGETADMAHDVLRSLQSMGLGSQESFHTSQTTGASSAARTPSGFGGQTSGVPDLSTRGPGAIASHQVGNYPSDTDLAPNL